jgi:hypothetical protein
MGELEERIARNNQTFRAANERIMAKADEYDARAQFERIPFLCECPLEGCVEIVRLTPAEYAEVRTNPDQFFTMPEHAAADAPVGRVVSEQDGYVIVEKEENADGS